MEKLTVKEIEKMERNFLTARETARALEISMTTFYRRAQTMDFPVNRIGRKIAVPREPFLAYLRSERGGRYEK